MGSRERYFGTPENSLLKRGAAAVAAGVLALSLSACKTTNATYPNSGSEISTSVGNGDEAAPGVSYDNDNGKWEKVEATTETRTDPREGLAVVDGVLTVCIGDDLYKYNKPEDDTLNSFKITTDENLVSVNDPTCIGSHPDSSSGWGTYIENDSNEKGVMSCVKYKDGEAEVYAETNKTDTTVKRNAIRGGCYFTRKNNSQ